MAFFIKYRHEAEGRIIRPAQPIFRPKSILYDFTPLRKNCAILCNCKRVTLEMKVIQAVTFLKIVRIKIATILSFASAAHCHLHLHQNKLIYFQIHGNQIQSLPNLSGFILFLHYEDRKCHLRSLPLKEVLISAKWRRHGWKPLEFQILLLKLGISNSIF